ncbi:MAG: alpha/beta fold hydrolase [Actinomycetes bacterium]
MHMTSSRDGTRIAFDRIGAGPPLILVEGALNDLATTMPLAAMLQGDFTVLAYDRRGRGASGDTAPYGVDREIEDLDAVIAAAGGSAFVFANCSGGGLVLEAAARGLAITGMVLYEPPFIPPGSRSLPERYSARLARLIEEDRRDEALDLFMRGAVRLPDAHVDDVRGSPIWPSLLKMAPTLLHDDAVMGDHTLPAGRLALVEAPVLVIDGSESPEWARTSVGELAGALPDGHRYTLEGHTHFLVPDAVAPVVRDFLTQLAAGAALS